MGFRRSLVRIQSPRHRKARHDNQLWRALFYLRRRPGSGSALWVPFDAWPLSGRSVNCPRKRRGARESGSAKLKAPPRPHLCRSRSSIYGGAPVRRPPPRFDAARNAWVTRAGGRLKILARGPQNAETEAAAWDAFYAHMARLGTPVEGS